jgi:hypothetical protein
VTTHAARTPDDATRLEVTAIPEPRVPSVGSMFDLAVE